MRRLSPYDPRRPQPFPAVSNFRHSLFDFLFRHALLFRFIADLVILASRNAGFHAGFADHVRRADPLVRNAALWVFSSDYSNS